MNVVLALTQNRRESFFPNTVHILRRFNRLSAIQQLGLFDRGVSGYYARIGG